jgi:V8-like Glu-specific endopeptidase
MKKIFFKKLSIMLLLTIIVISSFTITSNVNATSNTLNERTKVVPNMGTTEVATLDLLEDEKIMEYDATTGITREVDMDTLKEELALQSNGGNYDRIEPYDPLAENTSVDNVTTPSVYTQSPSLYTQSSNVYTQSPNVTSFPYRTTCRIKADVYGAELVASGYIAGPSLLVTAAHCVMNQNDNDAFFVDWVAYPGYNDGDSYNGVSSGWSKVYYSSYWKSTHSPAYDWVICVLNSNIGDTTGWYGTQSYGSNSEMNGVGVRLLGYPYSVGGGETQYYTSGTISNTQNLYFSSSAKSVGGFSGGPYARTSDNYVVGVCHGYWTSDPDTSVGVRITQQMIDILLENW